MKTLALSVVISLYAFAVSAQSSCLPGGITFSNQAQIDSFQVNYPGCVEIEGAVTITGNNITDLNGLGVLTSVFALVIENNDALVSLSGLDSLTTIMLLMGWGSSLEIIDNDALIDLTGLEGLTSFGNSGGGWPTSIIIEDNDILQSLEGINNIEGWTIHNLHIRRNPLLSICDITSICDYLAVSNGTVTIEDNAPGCSSIEEVEEGCDSQGLGDYKLPTITLHPTPTSNGKITITLDNPQNLDLLCFNTFGQQVYRQEITGTETVIDVSTWSPGIYLAVVHEDGKPVGRSKFVVR